ncbi:MAG: SCO family protein [Phycisphaeraceae bacterium]|nr:MAG: SCO family protein [Phycisphaeraceae bacterium]
MRPKDPSSRWSTAGLLAVCGWLAAPSSGQVLRPEDPAQARGLDVRERLGAPLPMELEFVNAEGRKVRLGDYFEQKKPNGSVVEGKPAVVALVYYSCPVVCAATMREINRAAQGVEGLTAGRDYNLLFFSMDEDRDTLAAAATQKRIALQAYGRENVPGVADGWQFHVGDEDSARALGNAFGYVYRKLENGEFSHPIVFFLATPEGKIARYIYGFGFDELQLRLAILEAGKGAITPSLKDRFLTFCYMYDPAAGAYTLQAMRVMQVGGMVCAVGLGSLIGVLLIGERMRKRRQAGGGSGSINSGAGGSPAVV